MSSVARQVDAGRFDEVVATLCAAFHDYPVMRYILKDAGESYDQPYCPKTRPAPWVPSDRSPRRR